MQAHLVLLLVVPGMSLMPKPALSPCISPRPRSAILLGAAPPPEEQSGQALPVAVPRANRPKLVLAVLVALYMSNQWARMLPSYLVSFDPERVSAPGAAHELMNADLNFDQAQYGLLISYGFSLLYTVCALPAGAACDRFSRKKILLASAAGWGAATAASSFARSYSHVLAARGLLAVAQAFATPAAITLIAALFSSPALSHWRATATSLYSSGIYLGGALASLTVMLSRALGWRVASLIVGASCVPPALVLALVLQEPARPTAPAVPEASLSTASAALSAPAIPTAPAGKSPAAEVAPAAEATGYRAVLAVPSVCLLLAASAARFFAGFAIGAWTAPFYRLYFPSHAASFSLLNAVVVSGAGSLSVISGGWLSDRACRMGTPHRAALIPAVGSLLAIPFWLVAMQASNFYVSMASLFAAYVCAECWYGVTISMMQAGLPPSVWGTAQGMLNMVQIVGNASPVLIGALLRRGASLRTLATVVTPASYVVCALLFWLASRSRRAELQLELASAKLKQM